MAIKKSSLEKRRYYRVAKVLLLLVPLAVLIFLFVKGRIPIPAMTQKNFVNVVDKNVIYLFGAIIGYGVYTLLLYAVWSLILYIGFGGLEQDKTKPATMIKKSFLERKLLYRIAKVIYRTFPLLAAAIIFTK
jgi:hypothetical protein